MANRFSVDAIFRAVDRVTAPVSRMQNRVSRFTRSMERGFRRVDRVVSRFARGMKRSAIGMTAALVLTTAAMADVVNTGADFDQTIVNAAVKFPGEIRKGTEAFDELSDAARRVGSTTEFTATQSAEALNFLAFAGFGAKESIEALPTVVDLATAAQVDLATATDIATDSLGAFNMLSEDSVQQQKNLVKISDILVATSTRANTTIETMFEALKQGAPVAVAAGQSIETTAALIATMANAGIKGTRAGTGLKNIMLAIAAPAGKAARVFRDLGVDLQNVDGGVRDAVDIFEDFKDATKDLTDSEKLRAFNEIFGKIPIAAAVNLANASAETRNFRDELLDVTGVSEEMAAVMRDTVRGRLNNLKSAIEGVKISLFTMNEGPLADSIDGMTQWTRTNEDAIATGISDFIGEIVDNFDGIVTWLKRIGVATVALVTLIGLLKVFVLVMTAVNLVMGANPVSLVVIGIAALAAAIIFVVANWHELVAAFEAVPVFGPLIKFFLTDPMRALGDMAKIVMDNWEPIKAFFSSLWADIKAGFDDVVSTIGAGVRALKRDVFGGVAGIGRFLQAPLSVLFGGGDEAEGQPKQTPRAVTPSERVSRSIEESRTTDTTEVTIKDDTGRAEVTSGNRSGRLKIIQSGAF